MSRIQKSTNLYPHPFSRAYWRDAAAELKDVRMLVFAALIIALRVALKTLVKIPLGPNLNITPAFLANALGAMIYGPVVGAIGAFVSDTLDALLSGYTYFPLYALLEMASSVIFAMFFYRQKITPARVILSRFIICVFVNILLQTPIDLLYYKLVLGKTAVLFTLPRIFKNLFMFPLESVVLTIALSAVQPITSRMHLTYGGSEKLHFTKKQVALLVTLVIIGTCSVFGYLFIHYENTSLTSDYSASERVEANKSMQPLLLKQSDAFDNLDTVTIVESAYKKFMGSEVTYTVAVYELDEAALEANIAAAREKDPNSTYGEEALCGYSKSPASKDTSLIRLATVTMVVDEKTGQILSYQEMFVR